VQARGSFIKSAFVFTDRYFEYDYGPSHPLRIERLRLTYELCKAYGLFSLPDAEIIETIPANEEEIARFHTPAYLEEKINLLKEPNTGQKQSGCF
jgi:acetoin utilization protein AcuC